MKYYPILVCLFILMGCASKTTDEPTITKNADEFYHYSIWSALVNKIYDGNLTVKEAKTHGDIGLGTYNGVDGELIMLDGILYQVPYTGEVKLANDSMHIPYLNTTFFNKDIFL